MSAAPVSIDERDFVVSIVFDVTERRLAEERTARALEEKTVLLKEVHHRVKNNLQIISSLLELQTDSLRDPADAVLFKASQDRVKSMAIVHELLYRSDDFSGIPMKEYAGRLLAHLEDSWSAVGLADALAADDFSLDIDQALPSGLILNELVTNAAKYADGSVAAVRLSCRDGAVSLEVEDRGPGLPPGVDPLTSPTLGLNLVRSLAAQLGGQASWTAASHPGGPGGLLVSVRFRKAAAPAAR